MLHKKIKTAFLSLALLAALSCERAPTPSRQVWEKESTTNTRFSLTGQPTLKVTNYYGGAIIYGHSHKDRIDISATRRAGSLERDNLEAMLNSIELLVSQAGDTVYVSLKTPVPGRDESYSCGLNLLIPYGMPVFIDGAKSSIITNELDSLVHVRNAKLRVLLARHYGSADIRADSDINLEIYGIPPRGFITAASDSGDVNMLLPATANATISAKCFYNPIELIDINLNQSQTSHYIATGVLGDGSATIQLETVSGFIRIRAD